LWEVFDFDGGLES